MGLENERIEGRTRMAQVVRGNHTLVQYQARRGSCMRALPGARSHSYGVIPCATPTFPSTMTSAKQSSLLRDGACDATLERRCGIGDAKRVFKQPKWVSYIN
ncbi:hypothetical protein HAX54_034988 [Datura stramonium]|uniref:Uncharacterized protein n=1 Tax=Datura stramonium TaxID=4076 RepID=A0ABS8VHP3_DATST|nr:hypothetical protein [Datura stramonium]